MSRDLCVPTGALPVSGEDLGPCAKGESAEMVNDSGQSHSPGAGGGDRTLPARRAATWGPRQS